MEEQITLKEWAVAVEALITGDTIMVMRKGGIVEETRDFSVRSTQFYLFPTYEHQRRELIKPAYLPLYEETMRDWQPGTDVVPLKGYAELVEDVEISTAEQLERISDCHIWTHSFAEERLRWKKKNPLHVLLLRVYRLEPSVALQILPTYSGCKSWIDLAQNMPDCERVPVLTDQEFAEKRSAIHHLLNIDV